MNRHGSLAATIERARHYGGIARDALGIFGDSEGKHALLGIVDFCVLARPLTPGGGPAATGAIACRGAGCGRIRTPTVAGRSGSSSAW